MVGVRTGSHIINNGGVNMRNTVRVKGGDSCHKAASRVRQTLWADISRVRAQIGVGRVQRTLWAHISRVWEALWAQIGARRVQ